MVVNHNLWDILVGIRVIIVLLNKVYWITDVLPATSTFSWGRLWLFPCSTKVNWTVPLQYQYCMWLLVIQIMLRILLHLHLLHCILYHDAPYAVLHVLHCMPYNFLSCTEHCSRSGGNNVSVDTLLYVVQPQASQPYSASDNAVLFIV